MRRRIRSILDAMDDGLAVEGIRKTFGRRTVLDDVSLRAPRGRITGLFGPNGAGKSTLFRILMGLVPADGGRARVDGTDVLSLPLHARAGVGLGYLPQTSGSFPDLTVRKNLLALLEVGTRDRAERMRRLDELLELAGLIDLADRRYGILSGGQQRRVEIAKALVTKPRVLLLDEPFAELDPLMIFGLSALLKEMAASGTGLLLADHHVHMALGAVDYAWLLHEGRVTTGGSPEELTQSEEARSLYFGDLRPGAP